MTVQKLVESETNVQWCAIPLNPYKSRLNTPQPESHTWVQLLKLFNPYSHDEALLLCPISNWEWTAWIPDHGEAVVSIEQFCLPVKD